MHPYTCRNGPAQASPKTKRHLTLSLPLSQRRADTILSKEDPKEKKRRQTYAQTPWAEFGSINYPEEQ